MAHQCVIGQAPALTLTVLEAAPALAFAEIQLRAPASRAAQWSIKARRSVRQRRHASTGRCSAGIPMANHS